MISTKLLSTVGALALVAAMAAPSAGFAAGHGRPGGGAAFRGGGAPAAHFAARAPAMGGGAPTMRGGAAWSGNRTAWNGGNRGAWNGGYRQHNGRFWPGAVAAGAVIGGAIAANNAYAYYGGPGYYDQPAYYDDQYVDDGVVAVVPAPVGDDSGYCAQRYRSYDPASGTYLGFDGLRHPCP